MFRALCKPCLTCASLSCIFTRSVPCRFDFLQPWHQYNIYYEFKKNYFMQKEGRGLSEVYLQFKNRTIHLICLAVHDLLIGRLSFTVSGSSPFPFFHLGPSRGLWTSRALRIRIYEMICEVLWRAAFLKLRVTTGNEFDSNQQVHGLKQTNEPFSTALVFQGKE